MPRRKLVTLENTKFIYKTNFSGNPENDKYGSRSRRGNIIIPTEALAQEIDDAGIDVKMTKPRDGEEEGFKPVLFMPILVKYDSEFAKERPPKVYIVAGNSEPRLLDEESIGLIDMSYVINVNATIEIAYLKNYDRYAAYVRTMYVEVEADDDPFADRYHKVVEE